MIKKDHHYIAETYLTAFANADGKVCMYRKDDPQRVIQQRPKELASHKHYFRQPIEGGGFDHNSLENLFSEVEAKWPNIVARFNRKEDVNDHLEDIFQFLALHRARVPAMRDAYETLLAELVRSEGRRLDRAGQLAPLPRQLEHLGDIWDHIQVAIDPHQSIHAMVDVLEGMATVMGMIGIAALHNKTDVPFVTSDNPVIWFDPSVSEADLRPYAIRRGGPVALLFPVSPNVMIYGHSCMRERFACDGFGYGDLPRRSMVERMNEYVCRFAYEAVFAADDAFADLVQRYADVSPVVETKSVSIAKGELFNAQYVWGQRKRKPKWTGT